MPPGPAHRSSQSSSWPAAPAASVASGARVSAMAASWLASSCAAAWPESIRSAGLPESRVKAYGDQRPGSAPGGMTTSRGGPPGKVAIVTRGRALPGRQRGLELVLLPASPRARPVLGLRNAAVLAAWRGRGQVFRAPGGERGGAVEGVTVGGDDPPGVAVADGELAVVIGGRVGGDDLQPAVGVAGGDPAQDRVDVAGRTVARHRLDEVDRGRDGGVGADPGAEELVRAEPEHQSDRRVELVKRAVAARGEHRVVGALAAQRAVGELGREGGVATGDVAVGQQLGQQQVGVGLAALHRRQDVVGGAAGVARPAGAVALGRVGAGRAGTARRAVPGTRTPVDAHLSRARGRRRSRPADREPSRRPACGACPAAGRRPGGPGRCRCRRRPRRARRGAPPASARTGSAAAPGSAGAAAAIGVTGQSLRRVDSTSVQAPGSGVQARIWRSIRCAGSFQSTRASAGVSLGARLTPSAGCGTALMVPSSIASRVATSSSAPEIASRSRRSPLVSAGRIGSVSGAVDRARVELLHQLGRWSRR